MAAVTQEKQYTPSLLSFFVYNPSFGPREGEVSANLKQDTSPVNCFVFALICFKAGTQQGCPIVARKWSLAINLTDSIKTVKYTPRQLQTTPYVLHLHEM